MGFVIKCIAVLVLLLGVFIGGSYYSKGGLPLEQWRDSLARVAPALNSETLSLDTISSDKVISGAKQLVEKVADAPAAATDSTVKMYKWKDAQGVVHFGNRPETGAQEIIVDTNINTIPSTTGASENSSKPKEKTMNDEVNEMRAAKQRYDEQMNGL